MRSQRLQRFFRNFDLNYDAEVAYLTGEREFVGKSWLSYLLLEPTIRFRLRIRESDRSLRQKKAT